MAKAIAVVGAGRGIGYAIAERFGKEGFKVALVSRSAEKQQKLLDRLASNGIEAVSFQADVKDHPALKKALESAIAHYGKIDVLSYSPVSGPEHLAVASEMTVENAHHQLELALFGAITAVNTVLPGMRERKEGAILFTSAMSAMRPQVHTSSFCVAGGAEVNYARVLHKELKREGIYAGIVCVASGVSADPQNSGVQAFKMPTLTPAQVTDVHWDLYTKRDRSEAYAGDADRVFDMIGDFVGSRDELVKHLTGVEDVQALMELLGETSEHYE